MPRMNILDKNSLLAFQKPPELNALERKVCFSFPDQVLKFAKELRTPSNQIGFLLSWGYFKFSKRFYDSENFNKRDICYVAKCLNYKESEFLTEGYDKSTRHKHQSEIIKLFGFTKFNNSYKQKLNMEVFDMVKQYLKPKLIFWRCIDIIIADKFTLPAYHMLQDLILSNINSYKSNLNGIIKGNITSECSKMLKCLFEQEAESNKYKLTLLKKPSQGKTPLKIKNKLDDMVLLKELYGHIEPLLQKLQLTTEGIRYFSSSVIKTKTHKLLRKDQTDIDLHLIAFIANQYYNLQDNLVDVFLSSMKSTQNASNKKQKDWYYENRNLPNENVIDKLDQLKLDILTKFEAISTVIKDHNLSKTKKLERIEKIVLEKDIADTFDKFKDIADDLDNTDTQKELYYGILEKASIPLQNRVSGILKLLNFQNNGVVNELMDAIQDFVSKDGNITPSAPLNFLSTEERAALILDNKFRVSLYKVFLFQHVAGAIKSGCLNLKHSYKYRSLDSYLISKEKWIAEKEQLLERANLANFSNPDHLLEDLDKKLFAQFVHTNKKVSLGDNYYIKFTKNGEYSVSTPKQEEDQYDALATIFPTSHFIPLTEILATVNWQTNFTNELQHWQQRYNRTKPINSLFAGLIGLGCAIGIGKMSRIANKIGTEELENAVNWHFSLDNVQAANDAVVSYMDKMDLPNIYRSSPDRLHTASDGQKFEVTTDSLNANRSFKYFGKGQGVSAYTFIDERNLLWHSLVFSAAERESAYVIDGLMRNDVIKSDIHSTDTHGYSEVIFAISYLLGFSFAPRIKNLKKQTLYIFKSTPYKERVDWMIKPTKTINVELIKEHWDDILRLVATIKLKENTASEIFRRLNSYSKQHKLYAALKAFGRIIKSLFITKYIDEVELRQMIEKQLNKVELSNRFSRAVAVGNPKEFVFGTKEEQEIAEGCNRLIKNSIICWNYMYLEKQIEKSDVTLHTKIVEAIKSHSPMSWAHINLLGEYDFSEEKMKDSCGILPSSSRF